jgi:hypothetical protein
MTYWPRIGQVIQTPTGPASVVGGPGARIQGIGWGDQLAIDVAKHVRRLALESQFDPDAVDLARRVCTAGGGRDLDSYAAAIRACLGRSFLFVDDPRDAEAIDSVGDMARRIEAEGVTRGDCDEAAALAAGLALCVGFREVRLILEAHWYAGAPYEHIYAELLGQSGWWEMNTTAPAGPLPPVGRQLIIDV